jgi:hypothetical protein
LQNNSTQFVCKTILWCFFTVTQGYDGDYMHNTKFEVPAGSGMTLARSLAGWWRSTNATDNVTTRDSRSDQGVPSSQHRLSAANYHVAMQWPDSAPCKSAHGVELSSN